MNPPSQKIPVGVLGATGSVGQKFVELLANHPWFELTTLAASERSAGKPYSAAVNWILSTALPDQIGAMTIQKCEPNLPCRIVFSALDADVAGDIETQFAQAGYIVVSNAKNHRMDATVPLLIPEVNADHLALLKTQGYGKGAIITNPNCSTVGLVVALKPLYDQFGIEQVSVVTMQALSGAGYPGVPSLDILDNVVPFIGGEEDKIETEPLKLLGTCNGQTIDPAKLTITAQCNRVAVLDGHLECVAVKFKQTVTPEQIIAAWRGFSALPQQFNLPTAPQHPIYYWEQDNFPQPRKHRNLDKGMAVSIGRLRPCSIFDYKFVLLSHNTVRGAAGAAILNAELLYAQNYL